MNRIYRYLPGLGQCWLLVALMFAGSLAVGFSLGKSVQSLTYFLSMAFPFAYILFLAPSGEVEVPLNRPHFGKAGVSAVFGLSAAAMICLSVISEPATHYIPMSDSIKAVFEAVFAKTALWDSILSTCILAPIMEEVLCRGVMCRGLMAKGSARSAIFWSAFLFALMHANPWQSIVAFIFGLLLGWLYVRTGCLWLTIFLHCLNNSVSLALTRLLPEMDFDEGLMDVLGNWYWVAFTIGLFIFSAIIYLLNEKTVSSEIHAGTEADGVGQRDSADI